MIRKRKMSIVHSLIIKHWNEYLQKFHLNPGIAIQPTFQTVKNINTVRLYQSSQRWGEWVWPMVLKPHLLLPDLTRCRYF